MDAHVHMRYRGGVATHSESAQAIERFHLTFLRVLSAALRPSQFVLKGGANLRYFFGSPRYSNDIDLDSRVREGWRLEEVVDGVLKGQALSTILATGGIALAEFSKPKQTETTQRWKVALAGALAAEVHTKIEFSTRKGDQRLVAEQIPRSLVARYGLEPPIVQRYTLAPMLEQKVKALALRGETQARDIFDLDLLFRERGKETDPASIVTEYADAARARARELPYPSFESQVLPFLEPAIAELYPPSRWAAMKLFVSEEIAALDRAEDGASSPAARDGLPRTNSKGGRPGLHR
jgi:predicted nucleotidyltransferase component of viral defense system